MHTSAGGQFCNNPIPESVTLCYYERNSELLQVLDFSSTPYPKYRHDTARHSTTHQENNPTLHRSCERGIRTTRPLQEHVHLSRVIASSARMISSATSRGDRPDRVPPPPPREPPPLGRHPGAARRPPAPRVTPPLALGTPLQSPADDATAPGNPAPIPRAPPLPSVAAARPPPRRLSPYRRAPLRAILVAQSMEAS